MFWLVARAIKDSDKHLKFQKDSGTWGLDCKLDMSAKIK